jgi:Fe-S-cluster containining protein
LEKAGYSRASFVRYDKLGCAILMNRRGYCVFYDVERRRCKAYKSRPLGCRTYPVVFSEEDLAVVDKLCPMNRTVSKADLRKNAKKVADLLRRTEFEAARRLSRERP